MKVDITPVANEQEIAADAKIKGLKFLGKITLKKGHTLFEINMQTQEIKTAIYDYYTPWEKKLVAREHCVYLPALNKANAIKHFARLLSK